MIQRQRKKDIFRSVFMMSVILCTVFVSMFSSMAYAQTESRKTIRAGFFAWDGYHVVNQDGRRSGYGYDFLKMTENYCNWKMELVQL